MLKFIIKLNAKRLYPAEQDGVFVEYDLIAVKLCSMKNYLRLIY